MIARASHLFLLSFVVYNFTLEELDKQGVSKEEVHNIFYTLLDNVSQLNISEYYLPVSTLGLILTILC